MGGERPAGLGQARSLRPSPVTTRETEGGEICDWTNLIDARDRVVFAMLPCSG